MAWISTIRHTQDYFYALLVLRRMHSYQNKIISSDVAYFRALLELLIEWSSIIRCTRSYFCPCLILRIMNGYCEEEIFSDNNLFLFVCMLGLHNKGYKVLFLPWFDPWNNAQPL